MAEIYNSNSNLKAAGVQVEFTPENVQEYIKCSQDPIYFIENYCYIVTLDHGLQLFKLYDCQKNKVNVIHTNRRVILMEGRRKVRRLHLQRIFFGTRYFSLTKL